MASTDIVSDHLCGREAWAATGGEAERDATSAQGIGPCLLGGPEAAVTSAPVVDPARLWLPVARFAGKDKPRVLLNDRMSWPALASWLQVHQECADKEAVGLWSPTQYNQNQKRKNENVISLCALVFDFDGREPEWQRLEPYEYVAHTTFSHGFGDPEKDKPPAPYWRVILPTAVPVLADQWEAVWGPAHYALAPSADAACGDVSRAYFNPSCRPGGPREARHHPGRLLDWRELPPVPQPDDEVIGTVCKDGAWAVRPGDDYNAKATVEDVVGLLEDHGAEVVGERGGLTYLRRPGKERDQSGSVGYKGTNLFYCFSSEWPPFEENKGYKPFAVYALLEHDGDFAAAAEALRERGFGEAGAAKKDEEAARAARLLKATAETAENLGDFKLAVRRFLNKKSSNSQKELLADTLADWGVGHERLLVANDGDAARPVEFLVDDEGRVVELDKDDPLIRYALDDAGVNAGNLMYAWIVNRLKATANRRARRVKLERYVARRDGRLYLSCGPTQIVVAEAGVSGLRVVRNGADGVLFTADAVLPAWDPSAEPVDPTTLAVLQPTLEPPHEAPEYTPRVQRLLLQAALVALAGGLRPVPAIVPLGASAGGKTTLARAIVRLLRGPEGDVSTISGDKRDFDALTTRRPVVAFDNLDGQAPSWFPDAFATAVTGGRADGRALYTNDDVNSRPKTAALVVTTRTANFAKRPDIVERLLPLYMLRPPRRLPDAELFDRLAEARDGALAWLARMAVEAAARSPQAPPLPGRLVDWARTVWALDPERGPAALAALSKAQQLAVADGDELAAKLVEYLGTHDALEGTPKQIVDTIDPRRELPDLGGGKAIARMLRELAEGLLDQMGVTVGARRSGNNTVWVIRRATADTSARRNGETEEPDELVGTPQGGSRREADGPAPEKSDGGLGAAPFLRFSAPAGSANPPRRGNRQPDLMPLSALVERQAREAVAAADREPEDLAIVDEARGTVPATESRPRSSRATSRCRSAATSTGDRPEIVRSGGRYH
ncbi:MAG TPA: hypothetical protein VFB66_23805 [Tepidisphaeraceae bacterium]|nr:hypothetical protein [Tepidisphaeraceae bacterium]